MRLSDVEILRSYNLFMSYNEILNSEQANLKNVIYKFTNLINGKVYIGQTRKMLRERLSGHIYEMKNNPNYFHKALLKYGLSNFDISVIEICENPEDLDGLEVYWISYYNATNRENGYNLTKGGSGIRYQKNIRHFGETIQSRIKRSISAKLKWKDEEYRKRYKLSRKDYIKVVKLDSNMNLIQVYPTFADAEKSICGKRNGHLHYKLRVKKLLCAEWKGFNWMTLDDYKKTRKVER